MKNEIIKFLVVISMFLFLVLNFQKVNIESNLNNLASVFFKDSITTKSLLKKFEKIDSQIILNEKDKIKIMIVPGHDDDHSGAVFGETKEADLNLKLAKKINKILNNQKDFNVFLSRDEEGYNPKLKKYLEKENEDIAEFRQEKAEMMKKLIKKGEVSSYINVQHNFAPSKVVDILYGINKYSNDNDFDIVLHIHFNDYAGRVGSETKYSGFSIYVPEKQYSNSEASYQLAKKIKEQLELFLPISNLPKEDAITEDQELIAVGAYNTSDAISILVEYGYIYEPQFNNELIKDNILDELAIQTYWGIRNYLKDESTKKEIFSALKDFKFDEELSKGDKGIDVLALQALLRNKNVYPTNEETFNNCPISGFFGDCTKNSLQAYQKELDIEESGIFDKNTIDNISPTYLFNFTESSI